MSRYKSGYEMFEVTFPTGRRIIAGHLEALRGLRPKYEPPEFPNGLPETPAQIERRAANRARIQESNRLRAQVEEDFVCLRGEGK